MIAEQDRRLRPRIIDTDWLLLRDLARGIEALVPKTARRGMSALDFGCGSKPYESLFTAAGVRYIGADFGTGAEVTIGSDGRLDVPDESVDLVLSFQVLEHVRDLGRYLSEAHRVLRRSGHMILSTHGTWLYHPHPEDHRRWTREGLVGEIGSHGFDVVDCIPVIGPLAWTTLMRLTCACYALRMVPVLGKTFGRALAVLMNLRAWCEDKVTPQWVTRDNACVYVILARLSNQ